jgi:hypothetical protein
MKEIFTQNPRASFPYLPISSDTTLTAAEIRSEYFIPVVRAFLFYFFISTERPLILPEAELRRSRALSNHFIIIINVFVNHDIN